MDNFTTFMSGLIKNDMEFLKNNTTKNSATQKLENYLDMIQTQVNKYNSTGILKFLSYEEVNKGPDVKLERVSLKENLDPKSDELPQQAVGRERSKRIAAKEVCEINSQLSKMTLNSKLPNVNQTFIKTEKLSILPEITENNSEISIQIKSETGEMAAPTIIPSRKKGTKKVSNKTIIKTERITRSKLRTITPANSDESKQSTDSVDSSNGKRSHADSVIVMKETTTVIELSDSDENVVNSPRPIRSTRTKTIKKKKETFKRTRSNSSDDSIVSYKSDKKKSKSDSSNEIIDDANKKNSKTVNCNTTYVTTSPVNKLVEANQQKQTKAALDTTTIIENPKVVPNNTNSVADINLKKKLNGGKQIFSAFEHSPVKKKVQAFEQLNDQMATLTRVTRTKTKAKENEMNAENLNKNDEKTEKPTTSNKVKEATKMFTPITTKYLPKLNTPTSLNKFASSKDSLLNAKSASALKASQNEFRERENRRREKEEAIRKREVLLREQIEEKKRIREEKQLKAQKQREIMERNRLKSLETQKIKEERHKKLIAEQEEKKQKLKEESERKRLIAKQKAIEEKKKEEKIIDEQKNLKLHKEQKTENDKLPVYMIARAPLLPTKDCYDSDDPENNTFNENDRSEWAKEYQLKSKQIIMLYAGENVKNTLYNCQANTPDLKELFKVIDPRKLKRTSSAVWHKPPRYTLMPIYNKMQDLISEEENSD